MLELPNHFSLTDMTLEHVEAVHEIFEECFTAERWSRKSIREELDNPLAVTLVVLHHRLVVAFLNGRHICQEGDINQIAVKKEYRRHGLASYLMKALFERAKKEQIAHYTLEVRSSNQQAIDFYHSLGFEQVGRRKDYYSKPKEDALLYRKIIQKGVDN